MGHTIEDFERLDAAPDVKMLAFSLLRRGPGRYHIIETARMLNSRHGKIAGLGFKLRKLGVNVSVDPEVIEVPADCPFLAAFAPLAARTFSFPAVPVDDDEMERFEALLAGGEDDFEEPTVSMKAPAQENPPAQEKRKPGRPKKGEKR